MTMSKMMNRVLVIALTLGFAALVFAGVIAPLSEAIKAAKESVDSSSQRISHYQGILASLPRLRQRAQMLQAAIPKDELLAGANPAEMRAALQSAVQTSLAASGAKALDSRSMATTNDGAFTLFAAEIDFSGSAPQIAEFIRSIEGAKPAIFVDHIQIQAPEAGEAQRDANGQPVASVSARLVAYALGEPSARQP